MSSGLDLCQWIQRQKALRSGSHEMAPTAAFKLYLPNDSAGKLADAPGNPCPISSHNIITHCHTCILKAWHAGKHIGSFAESIPALKSFLAALRAWAEENALKLEQHHVRLVDGNSLSLLQLS